MHDLDSHRTRTRATGLAFALTMTTLLFSGTGVSRSDTSADCSDFEWNMNHELDLFRATATNVVAAPDAASAPALEVEHLYAVTLADQTAVRFAAKPEAHRVVDGAKAGMVRLRVPSSGHYRLSADGPVWVDAVVADRAVAANAFNGHARCTLIHKSVDFTLAADTVVVIQFSQSPSPTVRFALTAAPAP